MLVPSAGFEPTTHRLGICCSILLSYEGTNFASATLDNVGRYLTLWPFFRHEGHFISLVQFLVILDIGIMHEDVLAILTTDESVTKTTIKPHDETGLLHFSASVARRQMISGGLRFLRESRKN